MKVYFARFGCKLCFCHFHRGTSRVIVAICDKEEDHFVPTTSSGLNLSRWLIYTHQRAHMQGMLDATGARCAASVRPRSQHASGSLQLCCFAATAMLCQLLACRSMPTPCLLAVCPTLASRLPQKVSAVQQWSQKIQPLAMGMASSLNCAWRQQQSCAALDNTLIRLHQPPDSQPWSVFSSALSAGPCWLLPALLFGMAAALTCILLDSAENERHLPRTCLPSKATHGTAA